MHEHLWAPWRMQYIEKDERGLPPSPSGCFLCDARAVETAAGAEERLVLGRGERAFVIMNRFPYNTGHLLVACDEHAGEIDDIEPDVAIEMYMLLCTCKLVLTEVMAPDGFNIGINQGDCAGAGLKEHLHIHIVPRWNGDTNFMPVLGGVKVMPQALEELSHRLRPVFERRGLKLPGDEETS